LTRQHTRLNYRPTRPNPIFYPVKAFDEATCSSEASEDHESKISMLFSTPRGGRFSRAAPFMKNAPTYYPSSISQRQPGNFRNHGAAGGIFPPARGVLNPPRRLHSPGSSLGTLQACTLPSYATAATQETESWRGICKFADSSHHDFVLVEAMFSVCSGSRVSNVTRIRPFSLSTSQIISMNVAFPIVKKVGG